MNRRGFFGLLAALPFVGFFKKPRFSIRKNARHEMVNLYGPGWYRWGPTPGVPTNNTVWIPRSELKPGESLMPGRLVHYKHAKS
jgi:hypothetical protein